MASKRNNDSIINATSDDGPSATSEVPSAPPGDLPGLAEFQEKWRGATIRSGALSPAEAPIEAAEAGALVEAGRARRAAYDPKRRPDDAAREQQCTQADQTIKVESRALLNDRGRLRQAQAAAAGAGCNGPPPKLPAWLAPCAVAALSLIFAISLHDLAVALGVSDGASWLLGGVLGLVLSSFLVLVQLQLVGLPGLLRGAFWGGVCIALGIGVMRGLSAADSIEVMTGLALAAVEIGLMVVAERIGRAHRARYATWTEFNALTRDAADACAAREERIRKAEAVIAERNAEVADRARRSDAAALEDLYLRVARAAVAEGIHINRGRLLGGGQ